MLTYFFMPSSSKEFELYDEILGAYIKNSNFSIDNKDLENYLEKYGLDLFLILILNKVISNLPLTKNQAMDSYKNFCNYAKTIFTNNKNNHYVKELWALLSLFFDSYTYNSKGFITGFYRNSSGYEEHYTYKYNKSGDKIKTVLKSEGTTKTYKYKYNELGEVID